MHTAKHKRTPAHKALKGSLSGFILTVGMVGLIIAFLAHDDRNAMQEPTTDDVTLVAKRALVDPARAPYGSGTLSSSWQNTNPVVSPTLTWQRVRDQNGVMIIGDSIANQASFEFASRMWDDHGLFTAVHNHPGRPTAPSVDVLEDYEQYIPARGFVMAVGANDIFNPPNFWQQVDRVMDIADGRPVYWITAFVERRGSTVDPDRKVADQRNSAWINQQLYAMGRAHDNLHIVDWHSAVTSGGNEQRVSAWLTDGVHLTSPSGIYGWCNTLQGKMGL